MRYPRNALSNRCAIERATRAAAPNRMNGHPFCGWRPRGGARL